MFLKKRIIATAAVIAMAAAAVYGSTQEMSQTQESGSGLQLFRGKEKSIAGIPMRHCPVISMRQQYPSENRTVESV